jgi:hypothetical protein
MPTLADRFPDSIPVLEHMVGEDVLRNRLLRLDHIFQVTELAWERNVQRFDNKEVRYLLIAEAAPWTANGHPSYFYESLSGNWVVRVLKAFFKDYRPEPPETVAEFTERILSGLADKGFLLVDVLPFALKYTTTIRKGNDYLELLKTCTPYFYEKLNDPRFNWAEDTRIALAFSWNGRRIIEAYAGHITLPSARNVPVDETSIATDGSNYTSPQMLREIWALP